MNTFSNIAFISYKREDEKWAVWLQKRLESYRLPSVIRSGQPGLPEYIRPVFRDKTDLGAGILKEELARELENSKFLIVICSPNSTKSEWINKEVSGFVEAGRSSFIIPFIVDGIPNSGNPENECFPKALQELPPESELLGININEIGREQAFIKVVARILDVKFDLLWDRHRRRLRRRKSVAWALFSLLLLAGLFAYDYTRTKVEYFDSYIDCYGIPHGIFPVNDISPRDRTYKFEYRRIPLGEKGFYSWRLSRVKYVNSAGQTVDRTSEYAYPSMELLYANGILTEIINKDRYDIPVARHIYTNDYAGNVACIVDFENAEKQEGSLYLSSLARSTESDAENPDTKLKIKRFVYTRDSLGRIVQVTYHSNNSEDLEESAISDAEGIFGERFVLDSLGRVIYQTYLNADGNIVPNGSGVARKRYTYDSGNNLVKEEYLDVNGNAVCAHLLDDAVHHFVHDGRVFGEGGEADVLRLGQGIDVVADVRNDVDDRFIEVFLGEKSLVEFEEVEQIARRGDGKEVSAAQQSAHDGEHTEEKCQKQRKNAPEVALGRVSRAGKDLSLLHELFFQRELLCLRRLLRPFFLRPRLLGGASGSRIRFVLFHSVTCLVLGLAIFTILRREILPRRSARTLPAPPRGRYLPRRRASLRAPI